MNYKKILFVSVLLLLICLAGCKNMDNNSVAKNDDETKIISVLIDNQATPFPPPPPPKPGEDADEMAKINMDSINSIQLEVVFDTVYVNQERNSTLIPKFKEFQKMVDKIPNLKGGNIDYKNIKSEKGHHLIFGNSVDDSKIKYSQIIGVSPIAFNDEHSKAAVYSGMSTGKLSGYWNLYLLEKQNDKWVIVHSKDIQIS